MQYDFSHSLKNKELLLQDFIEMYTACVDISDDERVEHIKSYYKEVFEALHTNFDSESILEVFKKIAHYKISLNIPYAIMSNEIYGLKNLLISRMVEDEGTQDIVTLLKLFKEVNDAVAHIYLLEYIKTLISLNNIRRNSLADLVEKNLIQHYESHLIWLTDLAKHIENQSRTDFPELNPSMCKFGKWIESDAKQIIHNNSKYKSIAQIHKNLHLFATKIYKLLEKDEFHILITYLEKCELISLSIGTELALLDQIIINKKVTKDTLTGALNRNGLANVFESQYELSLATSNPFILAMCDLDYFKNINDTYGHVAGDALLKLFVDVVKKNIRNSDVIIRYGGEEFIIMLPAIKRDKGREVLEKIRKDFEKTTLHFQDDTIQATVSMGMMEIKPEYGYKASFLNEYVMIVDQKLYMAKDGGRNKVESC